MRLIDAEALKAALKSNCKPELCHDYNTAWCERCCRTNDFEDLIDDAPTVEKRPTGEWLDNDREDTYRRCSICNELVEKDNYCGNCGADMRKGGTK